MGKDAHLEHDYRYDRADEFMEVVLGHWDTWEDDALIINRSQPFADPAKVEHGSTARGKFRSHGPFTVPRSARAIPSSSRPAHPAAASALRDDGAR